MMIEPMCKNHPDRPANAYYGKKYEYGLCTECVDEALRQHAHEPLDEHGERLAILDIAAKNGLRISAE